MKKSNLLMLFILGTIPEITLAVFLQDIWHTDFVETLIQIYLILIGLGTLRFIIGEVSFRLFLKKKMIEDMYSMLVKERFPNPWNYYEEDGISYFDQVGRDVNNEMLDAKIINGATMIYTQVRTFYNLNKFGIYWRYKSVLKIAVKKFMDENFETSFDDLNFGIEALIENFDNNIFFDPKSFKFKKAIDYLKAIVSSEEAYFCSKISALRMLKAISEKENEVIESKKAFRIEKKEEEKSLNSIIQNLEDAVAKYSESIGK